MNYLFVEYPKCTTCKRAKSWLDEHKLNMKIDI
ncbi:arsenate reductase-like glutaredoxin family protein [Clostridium saccharobutylicum]|nr:arsenate reductase-like glutaredoxin family protein [Clostridium saccharobutylicum]